MKVIEGGSQGGSDHEQAERRVDVTELTNHVALKVLGADQLSPSQAVLGRHFVETTLSIGESIPNQ